MDGIKRVTYRVSTLRRGAWTVGEKSGSLDTALAAARRSLGTKRFERVRVEQEFIDPGAKRAVVTTVFEEAGTVPERFEVSIRMLLGISVVLAVGMYFLTRFLLGGGLR
jgi:hypothetical protein